VKTSEREKPSTARATVDSAEASSRPFCRRAASRAADLASGSEAFENAREKMTRENRTRRLEQAVGGRNHAAAGRLARAIVALGAFDFQSRPDVTTMTTTRKH
jgi:hypothetical protein